jgi:2-keto-4-pentenoate hydratase/2-oxohepta-3-ene-1,7-dioic acid hydratase in catechol pathway
MMRLVTFRFKGQQWSQVGLLIGTRIQPAANLRAMLGKNLSPSADMKDFIQLPWEEQSAVAEAANKAAAKGDGYRVEDVELLAPIPHPSKVIGLGYNYKALCIHEKLKMAPHPELFAKLPTSVTGPFSPVLVPRSIDKIDYEVELGVVIGKICKEVSEAAALSFVAGYTVVNDVTAKIIPRPPESGSVVLSLKGADTFAPAGPCLVTKDEIPDPQKLTLICKVNGQERQNFSTSDMVHSVAKVIEYISERITLEPGDLISTGTSLGIGIIKKPPEFLNHNDVVECEIMGFGSIRNTIRFLSKS